MGRGALDEARTLLARAATTTHDDERVAELWTRIDRVERARAGSPRPSARAAVVDAVPMRVWSRTVNSAMRLLAAGALGALVVTAGTSPAVQEWISGVGAPAPPPMADAADRLPVLASTDVALVRARTLFARGRLAEALQVLNRIDVTGPDRQAADALRVEIQQILLSTSRSASTMAPRPEAARP